MKDTQDLQPGWHVPFFTIWTGQQLSLVGSHVAQFALVWWLTKTTDSATVLAAASMMAFLPTVFLGPFVGALVDRWNRRRVMLIADTVVALASLALAVLFWMDAIQVWHVYVIMLVRAVGGTFHWPAMEASTSLMVPREHLARVAGLNQTVKGVLNVVGAPLGALLMELLPLFGVMLVDVGTAALAILPLSFVRIPQPEPTAGMEDGRSIWADMRYGLQYIWGWSGLTVLIGFAVVFKIALTPAFALIPLLVSQHFGGDAAQLSLLEAIAGVGIILGGVTLSVWGGFKRKIYTAMLAIVIFSISFIVLGMAPSGMFWLALVSIFVVGLMLPLIDGPIIAILQSTVAPEVQGRVFTMMSSLLNITGPISLAFAGPVSDWLGLQVWYLAAGVLCGISGLMGLFIPAILNIEQNNNGHEAASREMHPAVAEAEVG